MAVTYSPTADPRVRIARHLSRKWRTEVQSEPGGDWKETGPEYMTRADALTDVESVVLLHFGTPEWSEVNALRAQVERLTAEKAELQAKVYEETRRAAALMVDGDRREQRALALLPDCEAHRRELQHLRHLVSWYWESMNNTEQARHAIVGALGKTVLDLQANPGYTVTAAELVPWLQAAIDKQNAPLKRQGYPTLADCLRSAAGGCEHDGISEQVKAEIAEALGLVPAKQ